MSRYTKDFLITVIIGFFSAVTLCTIAIACSHTAERNSQKDQNIKVACINNGKQLIDGNCLPPPAAP